MKSSLENNHTTIVELYGITFTHNRNGSIIANGTSSITFVYRIGELNNLNIGTYILSGCPDGGSVSGYNINIRYNKGGSSDSLALDNGPNTPSDAPGLTNKLTINNSTNNNYVFIRISQGYTCNNLVFWPMVRPACISDTTYSPYSARIQDLATNIIYSSLYSNNFNIYSSIKEVDSSRGIDGITIHIPIGTYNNYTFFVVSRYRLSIIKLETQGPTPVKTAGYISVMKYGFLLDSWQPYQHRILSHVDPNTSTNSVTIKADTNWDSFNIIYNINVGPDYHERITSQLKFIPHYYDPNDPNWDNPET